jgi:hypothetical protein
VCCSGWSPSSNRCWSGLLSNLGAARAVGLTLLRPLLLLADEVIE